MLDLINYLNILKIYSQNNKINKISNNILKN